ncbi:M23 family metallopeptidase [Streptomyces sp. RKND-216]|uniref:M23 family metallopeptidase n=1 Tax=Streptomyces sp. RKND-216 TaxID=2562581 RepID=UPI00109DEE2A|nr:M23 family metallopeptidase [Streptomyces sp. RKND-216]THA26279.1 M23 family metallopeptidase [Streptomyces sp. RKND-216]
MNAATRRPIAALRRAACGSLTAALLVGGSWGLTSPAAATQPAHTHDDPLGAGPHTLGGPWLSDLPALYGGWRSGPPESWASPVTGSTVSAPYGIRGDWAAGHHTGVDFAVPVGTPVHSVGSGKVVFAGRSGAYGKAVTVRMDDGKYTLFAHLSKIDVEEGDRVKAGTVLGESGNTGRSTGPHLHFEVREGRDYGTDVNPVAYLEERGVEVV